jgi:predicted MFS family arabinose efflux permease
LGVWAVISGSFGWFCGATILLGVFNGVAGFYRFAAAEVAEDSFRAQAISLVVAGGVVAALVGPNLATWAKDWLSVAFAGSLLPIVALQGATLGVLAGLEIPPLDNRESLDGRPLSTIARQPIFIVALLGSMVGYGVMILIMTATPLAMVEFNHPFPTAASVLQWHVLGMFAPSFVTGSWIARFGVLRIMAVGVVLNLLCVLINASGIEVMHFRSALLLLGIGWNFLFVGSTTLLTLAHDPVEKAKTQATHDFLMYTFVAIATFFSGRILDEGGWKMVNYAALPGLMAVLVAIVWLKTSSQSWKI